VDVNNTLGGTAVMLNQLIEVSGVLNMTNGSLDLNGFNIELGTTGSLQNESNTNKVFGVGEIQATRTLAASTSYSDIAGLGVSITTDAVAPGVTEIDRGHASQAVSSNNSIRRYYDIEPTVNSGLNATLRLAYFQDDLNDIDGGDPIEDQLIPWRSEDNGITWEGQHYPARLSNDNVSNWVQLTQIPAFSRWTLSDWLTEPLPITLLNFTAVPNGQVVDLSWTTASEINNDYFTIERSVDAVNFSSVLVREGAGNSSVVLTYTDVDAMPLMGLSYYRLKQTDFNGDFSYSDIVPVYFGGIQQTAANAWVNAELDIVVELRAKESGKANIQVFDLAGKLLINYPVVLEEGFQTIQINNQGFAEGVYLLSVEGRDFKHRQKLMIK
jgi:hypothetical protein